MKKKLDRFLRFQLIESVVRSGNNVDGRGYWK